VNNADVARAFDELADLLELAGENPFKLRAYRNFAETARELREELADVAARAELTGIDGVGDAIAAKVEQLLGTGTFGALEKARAAVPLSLLELMKLPGFGPKTVRTVWQQGGVTTLLDLIRACEEDRLAELPGIGKKKQARARSAALQLLEGAGTTLLTDALEAGALVRARLCAAGARECVVTGGARRGLALVHDVVILARELEPRGVLEAIAAGEPEVDLMPPVGMDPAFVTPSGTPARVRAVSGEAWVRELVRTTGSDDHVRFLEERAGGPDALDALCARAKDEADVYGALGLPLVPPELREGPGADVPAELVERLHGVFHVHTDWSDGKATLHEMVRGAADAGLAFVGVSDHSQAASYANGLDPARLRAQARAIEEERALAPGIALLHGVEVDILADGALDLPDDVLSELDFVIASVHTRLEMPYDEMTARLLRAVSHPLVTILGHPTGRLLRARRASTFDLVEVARAAAANDTYLEINGNGHRLDLSDAPAREAAAVGARFAIDPDAHAVAAIADTWLGLSVARRAGLSRAQVLNAMPAADVVSTLTARRERARAHLSR
jgi:DNA polymerase (family X)